MEGLEGLRRDDWYLVTANHQSWADILVLQKALAKAEEGSPTECLGHRLHLLDAVFQRCNELFVKVGIIATHASTVFRLGGRVKVSDTTPAGEALRPAKLFL